ncbi:hypothetical protein KC19_1G006600 [Ceratodon purpureus]|uniref:Secreted protein n=1 Tax=Ceratodon purpureus TaxID=3225 RepID=A0A8T0J1Y5_CERPU|nr:hypothetical protein KC19_1G006600 [Ceratodon purpureus]
MRGLSCTLSAGSLFSLSSTQLGWLLDAPDELHEQYMSIRVPHKRTTQLHFILSSSGQSLAALVLRY